MLRATLEDFDFPDSINTGRTITGSFEIQNNRASINIDVISDSIDDDREQFLIQLPVQGVGAVVTINDTTPSYELSSPISHANEGSRVFVRLNTSNVSDGTLVPYTISGAGITVDDLANMISLTGNFIVQNNRALLELEIAQDNIDESSETLRVHLDNDTNIASQFIINTSLPVYTLSASSNFVVEGSEITVVLETKNVPHGRRFPYTISGDIEQTDLQGNLSAFFPPTRNGRAELIFTALEDFTIEGDEAFNISIDLEGSNTLSLIIEDTLPTYLLSSSSSSVSEGDSLTINLMTNNIPDGDMIPYVIIGKNTNLQAADLSVGLAGEFEVRNNMASLELSILNDASAEGTETFALYLDDFYPHIATDEISISSDLSAPISIDENDYRELGYNRGFTPLSRYVDNLLKIKIDRITINQTIETQATDNFNLISAKPGILKVYLGVPGNNEYRTLENGVLRLRGGGTASSAIPIIYRGELYYDTPYSIPDDNSIPNNDSNVFKF